MRTTNCKIRMFCSVSSICHFISDVCKFHFYLPFTKKLLLCIFATKVGYVLRQFTYVHLMCFVRDQTRAGVTNPWGVPHRSIKLS